MPANLHFSIDIDGDRELSRKLRGLTAAVSDLKPFFKRVRSDFAETMKRRFAAEGAIEGDPAWAPLSARYAAFKARRYPGKPILQRTGALKAAATNPRTQITDKQLRMTIGTAWALFHQSSLPRERLPRRAFASLTRFQKTRWFRYLRDQIKAAADARRASAGGS